jgi:hypothetical protein
MLRSRQKSAKIEKKLAHPLFFRGCISTKCKIFEKYLKKVMVFEKNNIYLRHETILKKVRKK